MEQRGNWSSGCVRIKPLQCERVNSTGKEDGFVKLERAKLPDFAEWSPALEDNCRDQCLNNRSCLAYAHDPGIGCMSWTQNLVDIQKFSTGGINLYIRLAHSELDKERDIHRIIIITVVIGTVIIAISIFFLWRWIVKRRDKLQKPPLFKIEELAIATNNFSLSNKLGQGGLAQCTGQGFEEFMNEVLVISKLQHRNLVRLLGCCVEGEEKMLVYEYMPNKSLDSFIFAKQELLDWKKRFNIIEGISRGLLYLHRDSRLRIIRRDLKASNILLDEEMNPKISDFGMARIFGGNENQANTSRVVGTYGYMAPEYAMFGQFSEKSDVFSHGVLLLKIVSGRRNTDKVLSDPCHCQELLRCIHVGLLCVEESVKDRPTISAVISMLNSEIVDLPTPKQPAFTERRIASDIESPENNQNRCSINDVTVTKVEGR
ncbi:hypothetical protein PTKIN_Ptkin01aG0402600 [Pterospermum kingtungense]